MRPICKGNGEFEPYRPRSLAVCQHQSRVMQVVRALHKMEKSGEIKRDKDKRGKTIWSLPKKK